MVTRGKKAMGVRGVRQELGHQEENANPCWYEASCTILHHAHTEACVEALFEMTQSTASSTRTRELERLDGAAIICDELKPVTRANE
jgi:hypothetical protein